MPRQDLCARALRFSAAILALNRRLVPKKERFGPALNQLVRAATSIGANVEEAQVANSRRDMGAKYAIALPEAREARYWLRVIATDPSLGEDLTPLIGEATEWIAMLTTTVKKLRGSDPLALPPFPLSPLRPFALCPVPCTLIALEP